VTAWLPDTDGGCRTRSRNQSAGFCCRHFPNPVRLSVSVDIDPAGLPLGRVSSSLHVDHCGPVRWWVSGQGLRWGTGVKSGTFSASVAASAADDSVASSLSVVA